MNFFRKVEQQAQRYQNQTLLQLNDYAQHNLTKMVGRVIGVTDIDGDRKLSVELPTGKTLHILSHREFCLANRGEYAAFARGGA